MSDKSYCIFRLGTVLGEEMPSQTAANLFIESALRGEPYYSLQAHTAQTDAIC